MQFLARLNRPWIHFVLLGILLLWLQGQLFPEPKPTIGPLSDARVEALEEQWFSAVGRPPSEEQLANMVSAELDRDMLYQRALELELHLYDPVVYQRLLRNMLFLGMGEGMSEQEKYKQALEMRLHLGDEVVKRRMIQVVEQLLLAANPPALPSEAQIATEFEQRQEELRRPARYTVEHIYFNRDRESEIESTIAQIEAEGLGPAEARQLSSPFLPGYRFVRQTPDQLARHFGSAFVMNLIEAEPEVNSWVGPVRSTYGQHYVFTSEIVPARPATLEEVRPMLERDLKSQARTEALERSITRMREDYEVLQ
ncbi:peptidyl-prolyl cis-trans isomerase [Halioglobus maricola]|uniref:Peptidyl-prolyl cis-trans isomerase n=1 Tax=Halioglobus maricola TaxID=2601894 RepID=A0A5P9NLP7_9GAMM|nr:peptidylprolyl isomerase [Halioglobus maricola]QFU76426.1 peptidyl-prolyl cis-trans isomerase [Halioglobus maricola]